MPALAAQPTHLSAARFAEGCAPGEHVSQCVPRPEKVPAPQASQPLLVALGREPAAHWWHVTPPSELYAGSPSAASFATQFGKRVHEALAGAESKP